MILAEEEMNPPPLEKQRLTEKIAAEIMGDELDHPNSSDKSR